MVNEGTLQKFEYWTKLDDINQSWKLIKDIRESYDNEPEEEYDRCGNILPRPWTSREKLEFKLAQLKEREGSDRTVRRRITQFYRDKEEGSFLPLDEEIDFSKDYRLNQFMFKTNEIVLEAKRDYHSLFCSYCLQATKKLIKASLGESTEERAEALLNIAIVHKKEEEIFQAKCDYFDSKAKNPHEGKTIMENFVRDAVGEISLKVKENGVIYQPSVYDLLIITRPIQGFFQGEWNSFDRGLDYLRLMIEGKPVIGVRNDIDLNSDGVMQIEDVNQMLTLACREGASTQSPSFTRWSELTDEYLSVLSDRQ